MGVAAVYADGSSALLVFLLCRSSTLERCFIGFMWFLKFVLDESHM